MVTLYQLPSAFGLPVSVSPFCTKLEAYLKLAGHDYRVVTGGPQKSPTRRVPFVTFGDGRVVPDSSDIIAEFEFDAPRLDRNMRPDEFRLAGVLQDLAEGPIYHGCLYARFVEDGGWRHQQRSRTGRSGKQNVRK